MENTRQDVNVSNQGSIPPPTSVATSHTSGETARKRKVECPVFAAERAYTRPRTCNNIDVSTMSAVRRHLTRPSRGYPAQLTFLKLCPTCNEDVIDQTVFEAHHGLNGQLCNTVRRQRKGDKVKEQWDALYRKVETLVELSSTSKG